MSTLAVTLTGIAPATLTIELGTPGPRGLPGATGATGATGPAGAPGVGVPAGGSTGQYLVKTSGVDFATGWQTLSLSGYLSLDGGSMNANAEIYFEDAVQGRVALASGSAFAVSSSSNPDLVSNILYDRVFSKNATSMTTLKPTGVEFPDLTFQTSAGITAATAASTYYPLSGNPSGFLTSASLSGYATLSSPAFSGVPTAPSAALGTDSDQIATTAFVQDSIIAGSAHAETLQASVRNETGSTLSAFTVVYITGASGNKATVSKAQANAEGTSSGTFGILETAIPNNQNGVAITAGVISGQDTSAFAEGAQLWLSPTVAGGVTTTKPAAPNHAVFIGVVTRVHANQGTVEVRIANGFELQELHNVSITSVANGDLLAYESATSLWKNKSISTLDLATESWVTSQGYLTSAPVTSVAGRTGAITLAVADVSGAAPLSSPSLTGTPLSTTAAADTNSTQIATTAFVVGQASSTTPAATGTAAVGTSLKYARADHVHANPLPTGGTTGQVLSKVDGTNYNVQWSTASGGGGGTDYQAYTTAGTSTWTKPANAKWVEIYLWGGGGGGGSGARYATSSSRGGGGGGAAGSYLMMRVPASTLGATESVVVGAAGTAGASQTADTSGGNAGGNGGTTTFSSFQATGGGGGGAGSNTTALGGSVRAGYLFGVGGLSSPAAGTGQPTTGSNASTPVGPQSFLPTSGGGGAGAGAGGTSSAAGGNGGAKLNGSLNSGIITQILGGVGGTTGGVSPTAGVTSNVQCGGGTGGGGGAYITAVAGMAGAAGGFPSGGGGGGSASDNGFASGAGGAGAIGAAYIITYC